jgi:hypothetical protein
VPVPATHCQPWWLEARSPSTKWAMNQRAPRPQSRCRSFTRKLATIIRTRLCIHPSARLAHAGVDDGIAGAPLGPRPEQLLGRRAFVDFHRPHAFVQGGIDRVGPVPQDVGTELTPAQLRAERIVAPAPTQLDKELVGVEAGSRADSLGRRNAWSGRG